MASALDGFATNFVANVASDGTGSVVSYGMKSAIAMTPKGKIQAGDKALEKAIKEMRNCKEIPPIRRKRLAKRILDLSKQRKTFPKQINFWDLRLQLKIAGEAASYLTNSLEVYTNALELSASSTLENWSAVRTIDYAASHENLPSFWETTPSTPRAGDIPVDVFADGANLTIPSSPMADNDPMTPHASDASCYNSSPEVAVVDAPAPALAPSPSSAEPLINAQIYPPAAAQSAWTLNPLGGRTSKPKNHLFLKLNKARRTG